MQFNIVIERDEDGRYVAECYGFARLPVGR
jgi:predicted RNase H-like HicB family nuclease